MKNSQAATERAAAQKALRSGNLQDRDTYTAKQVAARCGTDSKTMRKFFRSSHSTVEPVGQGGRYEFDKEDLPQIKREFNEWTKRNEARARRPKHQPSEPKVVPEKKAEVVEEEKTEDEEPSEEDLAELEDIDLDLDDLDED